MRALRIEESIRIDKPVAQVFYAWTSGPNLARWFAPMAARPPRVTMDFREGGSYRIEMDLGEAGIHTTVGTFTGIVPNERIEMTWRCDAWGDPPSLVEVTFAEDGDGTWVRLRHTQISTEPAREGQSFGWQACLRQLEKL